MRIIQMSDTDTSDEAMREREGKRGGYEFRRGWLECRRRCEARMEEFRKEANETYRTNEIKWMNIVSKLRNEMEEERRKAFEAGYLARLQKNWNWVEAYLAFNEAQK